MIATILAAGTGSRLMPRTEFIPKTLVPICGKSMIFYLLDAIEYAGITETIIVTGYKSEILESVVGKRYKHVNISYIQNTDFEHSNNIYSFSLLKSALKSEDEIFVLESDLLIDEQLIKKMLRLPKDNYALVSPLDKNMDGTTVNITASGEIGKLYLKSDQNEASYDSRNKFKTVNIYRFVGEDLSSTIFPAVDEYMKKYGKDDYYEKVFQILKEKNELKLFPYIIDQHSWMEIDNPQDLTYAEELIT